MTGLPRGAGQLEEDLLERGADRRELRDHELVLGDQPADLLAAAVVARRCSPAPATARRRPRGSRAGGRRPAPPRACPPPPRAISSASGAWATERPVVDDDDLVGRLRDLGQHVAGDEHGASFGGQRRRKSRSQRMPCGSRPFAGSSSTSTAGRRAAPRPGRAAGACRASTRRPGGRPRRSSATSSSSSPTRCLADPRGLREGAQVVAAAAARVQHPAVEQRADRARRVVELPVGAAVDRRGAAGRVDEPEQHPQRRRLAGAVGPEEADDVPALDAERQVLDGRAPAPKCLVMPWTSIAGMVRNVYRMRRSAVGRCASVSGHGRPTSARPARSAGRRRCARPPGLPRTRSSSTTGRTRRCCGRRARRCCACSSPRTRR